MGRKSSIKKITRSNIKSKNIDASLIMNLYLKKHSPITTHFTGFGLAECDVISISASDYIYEYEVKISKSDFKNDFKKPKHKLMSERRCIKNTKKGMLYLTPNYFYFVVPENLINKEEVPEYAGLMYINDNMEFIIIKKAPLLHKEKANSDFIRFISHKLTCKLVFNNKQTSEI